MATVLTIEIATLLKAGLVAVVPDTVSVYADGVKDNPTPTGDKVQLPAVTIQPSEYLPMQYRSRQCAFPVMIALTTWNPSDEAQTVLYEVASAVGKYLGTATLALTLGTFDAIIVENLPERADLDRLQTLSWECMVHVLRPAT